jgi:hypothetical protein
MFESQRIWLVVAAALLASCATPREEVAEKPAPPPAPVVAAPPAPPLPPPKPAVDVLAEEARAMLAQAETDVQRARARRALWQRAWEDLVAARRAAAGREHAQAIRLARSASEFARLGLEQLAYPAVK